MYAFSTGSAVCLYRLSGNETYAGLLDKQVLQMIDYSPVLQSLGTYFRDLICNAIHS